MTSLVTGASGFIGSHLVDFLLARGDTVITLMRGQPTSTSEVSGRSVSTLQGVREMSGDVLDAVLLSRIIAEQQPDEIYHLAAQSLPNVSWEQPWLTHRINVDGTLNVLEAVRAAKPNAAVVVASSSSVYAQRADEAPIREDDPCHPSSPYGISKLAADHLARLYAQRYGLRVTIARPFFVIGTRKTGDVCSDWARSIVAIERGEKTDHAVGNLDIVRDFLHVADGVAGLAALAAKGAAGEAYNISAGRGWKLLDILAIMSGLARKPVHVRVDPARVRPVDERVKVGDNAKLKSLGWQEERGVEDALREILDYWREGR